MNFDLLIMRIHRPFIARLSPVHRPFMLGYENTEK